MFATEAMFATSIVLQVSSTGGLLISVNLWYFLYLVKFNNECVFHAVFRACIKDLLNLIELQQSALSIV